MPLTLPHPSPRVLRVPQLQGWMVQRALTGQVWNAAERTLELAPPSNTLRLGDRLPWFAHGAAGALVVGAVEGHVLEVHLGELRGVHVTVAALGWRASATVSLGAGDAATLL